MATHEVRFIRTFYQNLTKIIADSSQLLAAMKDFQHNKTNDNSSRYLCKESFGLTNWSNEDAAKFSGAVAEALALTLEAFQTIEAVQTTDEQKDILFEIQGASDTIKNALIPLLAGSVDPQKPFSELPASIRQMVNALPKEEETSFNQYSFFSIAAVTLVATSVVATTWALSQNR